MAATRLGETLRNKTHIMVDKLFHQLVEDYINNRLTKKELAEFVKLLQGEEFHDDFKEIIARALENPAYEGNLFTENAEQNFQKIVNSNPDSVNFSVAKKTVEKRNVITVNIIKIAVAASFIGLLALGFFQRFHRIRKKAIAHQQIPAPGFKNDVMPGGDKATLTLADGTTIMLDNVNDGTVAHQGNAKVVKLGAKLLYNTSGSQSKEIAYNTISTPRGGQYQIELPDGTRVWLNAASSLRFPVAFTGKERRVEIDGEAYFEVAKNKNMPFIAKTRGGEIQVLGTHFNVMAYREEDAVRTTLLEGSVKFSSGNNVAVLKPGEQAKLSNEGQLKIDEVDVEPVIAWKNGLFVFNNEDVSTVMRQLSRWYDVDVVYQAKQPKQLFVGEVPRNSKLSDVLKMLEVAGDIRFEIEGKKLIVI
jgi:ferric-dicitrate binding protein FerR (iron transport regulator)